MGKRAEMRQILVDGPRVAGEGIYDEAVRWWEDHHGKDFTKHYKVGDWIKSATSVAFVKKVENSGTIDVIRFCNNRDVFDNVSTVHSSRPFHLFFPNEFHTTPREDRGPGVWEYVCNEPFSQYHGKRTLIYGEIQGSALVGTEIYTEVFNDEVDQTKVGDYSATWSPDAYKPVYLTIGRD